MFLGVAIIYLIIKGALFATLVKAFVSSESLQERPWLMAGIWTGGIWVLSRIYLLDFWAKNPGYMQRWLIISGVLSLLYFWLLAKFDDVWVVWWTVLILGLGLVIY